MTKEEALKILQPLTYEEHVVLNALLRALLEQKSAMRKEERLK